MAALDNQAIRREGEGVCLQAVNLTMSCSDFRSQCAKPQCQAVSRLVCSCPIELFSYKLLMSSSNTHTVIPVLLRCSLCGRRLNIHRPSTARVCKTNFLHTPPNEFLAPLGQLLSLNLVGKARLRGDPVLAMLLTKAPPMLRIPRYRSSWMYTGRCSHFNHSITSSRSYTTENSSPSDINPRIRRVNTSVPEKEKAKFTSPSRLLAQGTLFDPKTRQLLLPASALRNGCRCASCVHPADKQRQYHFAEIPFDIQVKHCNVDVDGSYLITWKNDVPGFRGHVSRYTKQEIIAAFDPRQHPNVSRQSRRRLWNAADYDIQRNTFDYASLMGTSTSLALVLKKLRHLGLVFVSNVPSNETAVETLASRIGLLRSTFYGPTWDVRSVPAAKNVAYTSRDLGFHMDLLYMKEPPGFQLLHCLENTCEGGLSRFIDTFQAVKTFAEAHGNSSVKILATEWIDYEYSNDGKHYHARRCILTDHGRAASALAKNLQDVLLYSPSLRVYWSPPFSAPWIQNQLTVDSHRHRIIQKFAETLERPGMAFTTKLSPGTCVIFDNLRIAHARTAFDTDTGHRWLKGAYADQQDVYSTLANLEKSEDEGTQTQLGSSGSAANPTSFAPGPDQDDTNTSPS